MRKSAKQEIEVLVRRRKRPSYPSYRPTGVPWLGNVPEHWPFTRLRWTFESTRNGVWGSDPDGITIFPVFESPILIGLLSAFPTMSRRFVASLPLNVAVEC